MTTSTMMTVLVCGGRDYTDRERVYRLLTFNRAKIAMIVHGAAKGADTLADDWARANGVPCLRVPAEWEKFGKKAGFLRNEKMLSLGHPDLVVAFPGGVGTAMMVQLAKKAGVRVVEVPAETPPTPEPKKAPVAPVKAPPRPVKANGSAVIQPSRAQLIDRNIAAGLDVIPI